VKLYKPWYDECSQLLDQRKQAKFEGLQNPSQTDVDNLSSIRHATNGNCRNSIKKKDELETNSKNINIRDLQRYK
jgi:hypothetical protein